MSKKTAATQKPSQHLGNLVQSLSVKAPQTTGELANALGLSSSRVREILTAEVKRGNLVRTQVDDDGVKYFEFSLPASKVTKGPEADPNDGEDDEAANDLLAAGDAQANDDLLADAGEPAPKKAKSEAKKKRVPNPNKGMGNPLAKKAINPQQTLDDKKKIARDAGGDMTWANRTWTVTNTKKGTLQLTSQDIAGHSLATFAALFAT